MGNKKGWTAFKEEIPNLDKKYLLTNNLEAKGARGQMSHVWLAYPMLNTGPAFHGEWIAFDNCDHKISCLTHWLEVPELMGN